MTGDELSEALREASAAVNAARAHQLAVAAEWDRREAWAADGAYSGRCWLADRCTLSRAEAAEVLRTARVVASAPVVAAAVADGSLPVAKAEVLAAVVTSRTEEKFVADQQVLVDAVGRLGVDETRKLARWWQRLADHDGPEPAEPEGRLRVTAASDGTTHLAGTLDAEGGAVFGSVLDQLTDQLWRAERAGTGDDRTRPPVVTRPRLRAEALVVMARLATAADPARRGARPLINVLIDLPTLEARADRPATLDGGGVLTAEAARRLACDADVARVLTGPDGAVVDLGRTARTATADQWRALRLRDGGCTWPGCDRPPSWCQAHHIVWWEHQGRTDLSNLTLLCSHHHHRIHDAGWHLQRVDDGGLLFTGPDGRTLQRPPPSPPWPMPPPRPRIDPLDRAAIRARVRTLTIQVA
ncbi:MAG: HNH endonuclease [Actinomycetota bacterium]|nr:HNH endonuclease [Actinomycetota bacterium]